MPGVSGATAVAVTSDLTCLVIGGGLQCWGDNPDLLSGNIVVMAPGSNVTAVTVGRSTVCVIVTNGVQCFGLNSSGQLGIGSTTDSAIMVQTVPAGAGVTSMSAGLRHSCATVGGAVTCWGRGSAGQLGDPTVLTFGKKVFAAVQIVFAPQTITFTTLANKRNTDAPFVVSASGGASANPVVFSSQTNAICTAGGANGSVITLTGIAGTCTIAANQAGGNGYAAANEVTSSFTVSAPVLLRVLSRKTHGVAGVHDLPIEFSIPISGAISVEPRVIGTEHTLVFQFDGPVNPVSGVTAKDELANSIGFVSAMSSGNDVVVTLTSVPDNRRAKITVPLVNGAASMASASIGFLVGDVNSSGSVTTVDTSGIKARSGSGVNSANFWFDLNASGEINASDIAAVKARVGLELP